MPLTAIPVTHLQYLETGQFIIRFLTDFESTGIAAATDAEFNSLYQQLLTQSPKYNEALTQIRAKAESEVLSALDLHRDRKIVTLRRALYVFEYTDNAAEKTAFEKLKIVLRTYGDIEKANFEAESLGIDNLVKELRNTTYFPFVQQLKLEAHITNLETSNTNFKTTFNKRSSDTVSTTVYDAKALRKTLLATYNDMAEYIAVMAKRKNTAYYNGILTSINNGRQYFADLLARREGGTVTPTPAAPVTPVGG